MPPGTAGPRTQHPRNMHATRTEDDASTARRTRGGIAADTSEASPSTGYRKLYSVMEVDDV